MTKSEWLSLYAGYDEDDDDVDLDEFLEQLEKDYESFEQRLERYNTNLTELRSDYAEFLSWYEKVLKKIAAESPQKAIVCYALCRYINQNSADEDSIKLWCICLSESSDILFETNEENDEQHILYNFMELKADIENMLFRLKNEDVYKQKFLRLTQSISFSDKHVLGIDTKKIYHRISMEAGISGECLEDNLNYISSRICHSPELAEIAPIVYYTLVVRYRKKLVGAIGFEPNFKNILRNIDYITDIDNGKNIASFYEHLGIYSLICDCFESNSYDRYFCDVCFAEISNITECSIVDWSEYPDFTRPLFNELSDRFFSAFPNGLLDNPVFTGADVHPDDMANFEFYDEERPKRCKILGKVRAYISGNPHVSEEYLMLLKSGEINKCMPIVFDVLNNSGVETKFINPEMIDVVNAVIMQEILEFISADIKEKMLDAMKKIKE